MGIGRIFGWIGKELYDVGKGIAATVSAEKIADELEKEEADKAQELEQHEQRESPATSDVQIQDGPTGDIQIQDGPAAHTPAFTFPDEAVEMELEEHGSAFSPVDPTYYDDSGLEAGAVPDPTYYDDPGLETGAVPDPAYYDDPGLEASAVDQSPEISHDV